MMQRLKIATAQFENRSGDKIYNLSVINQLAEKAAQSGAEAIAFHECSVTGYSFARNLSEDELRALAEPVPAGPSVAALIEIAGRHQLTVLAGLFEVDMQGNIFNTYVAVAPDGLKGCFRKLHPFIHPALSPGNAYCIFSIKGWQCGILICYDNNVIENVRATALLGADIIFMPHVTMCTPSTRPGAGFVAPELWEKRETDPTPLRIEFEGMKGRQWLLKWLPSRAYDNGIYVVFANPIGMDGDQLKNGCSMIVDPFGDIVAECRDWTNSFAMATLSPEKLQLAGGYRYRQARRPELYGSVIAQGHKAVQKVAWLSPP